MRVKSLVAPKFVCPDVATLVKMASTDDVFKQSNHNGELLYVQVQDAEGLTPVCTERGNPVLIPCPFKYEEIRHQLRVGKHMVFLTVDSFRDSFVRIEGVMKVQEVVFMQEMEYQGNSRFFYYGEDPRGDVLRAMKSKPSCVVRAYVDKLHGRANLIFPRESMEEAKEFEAEFREMKKKKLLYISGMLMPTIVVQKERGSSSRRVVQTDILVNEWWVKDDAYADVEKIIEKVNSIDDVTFFRDLKTGEPLYPEYVRKMMWYSTMYVKMGDPVFNLILSGDPGVAKCHGRGTRVLMYDGVVKNVEDVVVGDKLMGDDATARTVQSVTSGRGRLYRVNQKNGDAYIVNENHVLSLRMSACKRGRTRGGYKVGEVIDIPLKEYVKRGGAFRAHAKGYKVPVRFESRDVRVDSYFLGVWLGDGTSEGMQVCSADDEIVQELRRVAEIYDVKLKRGVNKGKAVMWKLNNGRVEKGDRLEKNGLLTAMKTYGIVGKGAKRIPIEYKCNDERVRLEVLAGLIDTDGTVSHGNQITIAQTNDVLANDIAFIARSLGLRVSVKKRKTICQNGVRGTATYVIISGDTAQIPCRVERKRCSVRKINKNPLNAGITVENIGVGDFFGFSIDGNHRYLLSDFTVTHNSTALAVYARIFSVTAKVLIGSGGTKKGLIPSFSGDVPREGALVKEPWFAPVDEFFTISSSEAVALGVERIANMHRQYIRDLLPVITRSPLRYPSAKDDEFECVMEASLMATDNLVQKTREALKILVEEDPAVLRRFCVVWLGTDVKSRVRRSPSGGVDDNMKFLEKFWLENYGFSVMGMKRLGEWCRGIVADIQVDGMKCLDIQRGVMSDLVYEALEKDGTLEDVDVVDAFCRSVDFSVHIMGMVRCEALMREVYASKGELPKVKVEDQDYESAKELFKRVMRDSMFLFDTAIWSVSGGVRRI